MTPETVIEMTFMAFVGGGLAALFWARLNRLEGTQDEIRHELAGIRERMSTREDVNLLREELGELRGEMAVMRSDMTHVALAVGAHRPKPMEG